MRVMKFLAFLFQELQFLDFTGVNNFEWSSGQKYAVYLYKTFDITVSFLEQH